MTCPDCAITRKPTVPEVLPLVRKLYRRHSCGCCLHVVLDDGNVEDSSVKFCIGWAEENKCDECKTLAEILLLMSKTQRKKLARHAYG